MLRVLVAFMFCQQVAASENSSVPFYTPADDASWAIHSTRLSKLLGPHTQAIYDSYMKGCYRAAKETDAPLACQRDEKYRMEMNKNQPSSVRNYTKAGYQKIRAPAELFDLLKTFYEDNKGMDETEWHAINTYHNMWDAPPTMMHLNQPRFKGGGPQLQSQIWAIGKKILEEWSGQELSPVSLYGVRLYHNGSILAPHVDRFPLIVSAIINVDQDVDEDWPLEVYGHDGKATNVSMVPGDMVLYESHSVIHGRPFPLNGRYFANAFMHFEPVGSLDPQAESWYDPELDLPPYLISGSAWEADWRTKNPNGWKGNYMDARTAARKGDAAALKRIAKVNPSSFSTPDDNGWTPFHEAVRVGDIECVETILFAPGSKQQLNQLTYTGVTPLNIAREFLGEDHEVTKFLVKMKAVDKHPNRKNSERDEL